MQNNNSNINTVLIVLVLVIVVGALVWFFKGTGARTLETPGPNLDVEVSVPTAGTNEQ